MGRRIILFGGALALVSAAALIVQVGRDLRADEPDLASVDLAPVLVFADAGSCQPSPQLERLLAGLFVVGERTREPRAGAPVTLPGFAEPLHPRLEYEFGGGPDAMGSDPVAILDLRGRWHGLNVVGLRTEDGSRLTVRFSDDPVRVRQALVSAGFPLPDVGQSRYPGPGASPGARTMGIYSDRRGGASLLCTTA